ncbi:MAG: AAA family ATPase, partial [Nitriliruptorales bacterium]|nr:AAA family ATPase [Nitriliruptorales bacterium]
MDPEDWSEIVNVAVADMAACVERYDGTMSQFAGDSILALFGAPVAHEEDPYRAIRAAVDIVETVRTTARQDGSGIDVRVGINTGLVVVGGVDAGDLSVYSALGDMPNVAARLQALAEPGSILISEDTFRLVVNDVEVRAIGATELKGRELPVSVYEVLDVRTPEQRRRGLSGFGSRMVGREAEASTLASLVDAAAAGAGRVAAIVGEPGVGKSRLVAELAVSAARDHPHLRWAEGRCVPFDDERPFHLVSSLVRALAGISEADDPGLATKAVRSLVEEALGGEDAEATRDLLTLLGLAQAAPGQDPERLVERYGAVLRRVITGVAADQRPLVLVCEDMHWMDGSSGEIVSTLFEHVPTVAALLLVVMRPDREGPGWEALAAARRNVGTALTELHLDALGADDSRELVANLLEIESLPGSLRTL